MTGAQIIREARLRAGLTQAGLAERLGRERAQVARWETGRQQASFENLRAVVEACGFVLKVEIDEQREKPAFDSELETSLLRVPDQRVQVLLGGVAPRPASERVDFDPYTMFEALETHRVEYVVIGGFARIVHGSGEVTRGLDIVPSLRGKNLRHLAAALVALDADPTTVAALHAADSAPADPPSITSSAGRLIVVATPWGTQGYDDIRIRANRESVGHDLRPRVASLVDLVRSLEASDRLEDLERLYRLRRMMELARRRSRASSGTGTPAGAGSAALSRS